MIIREARLEDAAAIAAVRVASWRSTYRGKLPDIYLDSMDEAIFTSAWEGILSAGGSQGYTYVAANGSQHISGFAIGGWNRLDFPAYQGELYAIYLLEAVQRKGLGRRLTEALARRLLAEGMRSMLVWVLASNPARRFYQKLGGKYLAERESFIGGTRVQEIAYGWEDITLLSGSTNWGEDMEE